MSKLALDLKDARSYLQMNDWDVPEAVSAAVGDLRWEVVDQQRQELLKKKLAAFEVEERAEVVSIDSKSGSDAHLPSYQLVDESYSAVGWGLCVPFSFSIRLRKIFTGLF